MGIFSVEIEIGGQDRESGATVDVLVDTGASITSAPVSYAQRVGC